MICLKRFATSRSSIKRKISLLQKNLLSKHGKIKYLNFGIYCTGLMIKVALDGYKAMAKLIDFLLKYSSNVL